MRAVSALGARLLLALTCAASVMSAPARASVPPGRALRSLQATLRADLRQAGGQDGALVIDQTTGRTLFSAAPRVGRLPASVEKLYTTSTALIEFGPRARLQTNVYGVGSLAPDGTWQGTVYLRGGGDPTFGDSAFDRAAYGAGATVQSLASAVAAAGVRTVHGRIVGDESLLDSLRGTPATGFAPDLEVEGELSGLVFDAGFTNPFEASLQPRPALFAAQAFASALRAAGVRVPARTRVFTGITPPAATLLAHVDSPTMAALVRLTNTPSDNFFAEMLLKDLGARFGNAGTTAAGAAVVRTVIAQHFGLHPALNDGSGLSRADHTSPAQVVSLLEQQSSDRPFINSLAVAGVSGTMEYEMVGTRAVGNCRGKTGTLHDVASLVGYCTAANGDRLVFAFLFNNLSDPAAGHAIEDQMGAALADYNP